MTLETRLSGHLVQGHVDGLARLVERVEADGERDDPDNALGPYPTPQQARDWRTLRDARDEAWQEADDAWSDDPEGPCE